MHAMGRSHSALTYRSREQEARPLGRPLPVFWPPHHKRSPHLFIAALFACAAEYEPWLVKGVSGFRPPSEASRKALESEASLSIGSKKLPVEAGLRAAAADVSRTLCLDEVQAYILLRRWVAKAGAAGGAGVAGGTAGAFPGGAGAAPARIAVQPGASLSPAQRLEVAQLYHAERLWLLKSIENLLWEGERELHPAPRLALICCLLSCISACPRPPAALVCGTGLLAHPHAPAQAHPPPWPATPTACTKACAESGAPRWRCPFAGAEGGPLLDVIEGALGKLLEQSLEDTAFQALQSNLEPAPTDGAATAGGSANRQTAITLGAFGGGAPGWGAAATAAALAEAKALGTAAECCSLLSILILIYYHPRKQCTPDRFLSLAKLFHASLLARGAPRAPASGPAAAAQEGDPSPAQMSVKLVSNSEAAGTVRAPCSA